MKHKVMKNTKHEIRNNFEILMFKFPEIYCFWSFEFCSFDIVSNFEIRYSNFISK